MCFVGFGKKVYIVYYDLRYDSVSDDNWVKSVQSVEEVRWLVVKSMLDDFPVLKKKVKDYVQED